MNVAPGVQQPASPLNMQILMATLLVIEVSRDLESLVPQALREGVVAVDAERVRRWQTQLQTAVTQLSTIPTPLIFPPPPFSMFVSGAIRQINQALATLAAIPLVGPQVSVSLETIQFVLQDLAEAIALLIRALQTA